MLLNISKYSLKNILRNKFLTISTILVLTLLMFFINILQILDSISIKIISEINSKMTISLYLKETENENSIWVITLKENILKINKNISFTYKNKDELLQEMQQKEPELADIVWDENPLPETIILWNIEIPDYPKVNLAIENQINILDNNEIDENYFANYKTQYDRIQSVTYVLTLLEFWVKAIIFIFFVSIAVITYSVVWNFIYYFRNEIYITRLVWGSRSFIYWPFILQGIIYSVVSFFISLTIFILLLKNLDSWFWDYFEFTNEINEVIIILQFFIFILIWGVSWFLSSKKYLKDLK